MIVRVWYLVKAWNDWITNSIIGTNVSKKKFKYPSYHHENDGKRCGGVNKNNIDRPLVWV